MKIWTAGLVLLLATPLSAQGPTPVDRATYDRWMTELSNWGRWGDNDQLGTLNLITPEKRKAAAALVTKGISVSMAHDTLTESSPDNGNPYRHEMLLHGATEGPWAVDNIGVVFHGYAHSHMDALCHRFHDGTTYNGYARSSVTEAGCGQLAVTAARDGIFARGILMDIPRLKNVSYLASGTPIYIEDLEAWERQAQVTVGEGDVLLIRTGRWALRDENGPWAVAEQEAGLHASTIKWLKERGVAMLGSDSAADVFPSGVEGETHPVHVLALVALGMPIFDNLDLEDVAAEAARQNRWEFLLTAAPLRVPGGTGSPLNPIATF